MPPPLAKKPKLTAEDEFAAAPYTTRKLIQNLGVEPLNLPRSMVNRLAKGMLPPNTSIQRDALLGISKSATVFVNYLASHANDRATLNNKKTIQPDDVFEALKDLEFEDFVERCHEEEKRYAAMLNDKRNNYRHRIKEEQVRRAEAEQNPGEFSRGQANGNPMVIIDSRSEDEPPASKKPRLSAGTSTNQDDSIMHDDDNDPDEEGDTLDENDDQDEDEGDEDEEDIGQQDDDVSDEMQNEDAEDVNPRHTLEDDEASDSE